MAEVKEGVTKVAEQTAEKVEHAAEQTGEKAGKAAEAVEQKIEELTPTKEEKDKKMTEPAEGDEKNMLARALSGLIPHFDSEQSKKKKLDKLRALEPAAKESHKHSLERKKEALLEKLKDIDEMLEAVSTK
mmetsp:Transcript_7132/g.12807  ORF Transcript_7132/g.12807 Transcript_7132/m.12807 type:complete len:131 (-) Transcript_7132:2837-3229(-)